MRGREERPKFPRDARFPNFARARVFLPIITRSNSGFWLVTQSFLPNEPLLKRATHSFPFVKGARSRNFRQFQH